tara:strand:+ start:5745 stop:6761 length:1017 start_codon:yes stop_codon:yes gene_type:complete
MSGTSEGLALPESDTSGGDLLDAFIDTGDFADADYLEQPEEAPKEAAEAATDADTPETDEDADEDTEIEAKDAEDASGDEDGDYVEFDTDDGTTERVSVSELLEAHAQFKQLGSDSEQIRSQIAEAYQAELAPVQEAYNTQVNQLAETYALLQELMPNVEQPSTEMLDERSQYYNPQAYRQQLDAYERVNGVMGSAREKIQEARQQHEQLQAQQRNAQAQKDWQALLSADKTWGEGGPAKRLGDLRSHVAQTYGIDDQIVASITNPGFIRMAEDAKAYRAAKSKTIKPKAKTAPRLVKGGTARKSASPKSARQKKAAQQLAKTGRVTDLEATWGEFLD